MIRFDDLPDSLTRLMQQSLTHGWSWSVESTATDDSSQMLVASVAGLRVEADVESGKLGKCRRLQLRQGNRVGRVRQIAAEEPYVRKLDSLAEALAPCDEQGDSTASVAGAAPDGASADFREVCAWIEDVATGDWLGRTRKYPLSEVVHAPRSASQLKRIAGFVSRNLTYLVAPVGFAVSVWCLMSAPVAVVLPAVVAPIVGSLAWMVATRKQLKMLDADSAPDPELPPESMAQSDTAIGSEVGPDRAVLVVAEQICDNIDALTAVYDEASLVDVLDTAAELNEIAATTVKLAEIRLASDGEGTLFEQERIAALTAEREGLIQRVAALFTYGQQLAAAVRVCQEQQRASAQTDLLVLSEIAELPSRLPDRADFYARGVQHEEAATRITHAANQFGVSPRADMDLGDQADLPYHASKTIVLQEFSAEAIEDRVAERAAGNAELEAQFIASGVTPTSALMVPMMPMMSAPQSPPEYASCHPCGAEPCDIPDLNPVTHRGENPYGYQTRVLIVPRDAHGFKGRYLDCPVEIPMAADKPVSEHIAALIPYLVVVSKAQGKDASWFEDESARWVLKKALVRQPLSDELSLAQQNIRDGSFLYLIKREVPKADIHTAGPVEGEIAEVVRNRRLQLGFSLKETADRADISASLLAGMECGRARLSAGARDRLEVVLGLPRGELGQSARGETTASSSTFGAWEQGF